MDEKKIKVLKNGPYQVKGNVPLDELEYTMDPATHAMETEKVKDFETGAVYAICRCGRSKNYPFCDGSHLNEPPFDGTEVASTEGADETIAAGTPREASMMIHKPTGIKGPMMVKGGIPVEGADGKIYPIRESVSLCRCGKSKNKPFCDGSHMRKE